MKTQDLQGSDLDPKWIATGLLDLTWTLSGSLDHPLRTLGGRVAALDRDDSARSPLSGL